MKGFIKKTLAALSLAGGLGLMGGCQAAYHKCVDPCWPQRYNAMAADSVNAAFSPQVENGHVLDQTVWNHHFEPGKAELTPGGRYHLSYLSKRRPAPDPRVFLQTAYDVPFDAANPGKFADDRAKLDNERHQVVIGYLQAQTAGRPVAFQVQIHDPGEVGIHSVPGLKTISDFHGSFKGTMPSTISSGGLGGGGGGGGGR
jgi:hypothetical protein